MIGRRLSHYEILDEISRGGMGVVYRAKDLRLNRDVALKVLPEALVSDQDRRRRFVQEAQAASALEHPHIAVIHEIDEADGITFIAMELIRGEKLRDVVARRRVPVGRALEMGTEIAEGLARAHDKNIVHRDLKPDNVMVTDDGHVKIIDFGLAKLVETDHGALTGETVANAATDAGVVLGTLGYMSPEQASGDRVDHRTDIFAFGVVLYEMLSGERPFQGRTGVDTLHAIINTPAPRLPDLGASVLPDPAREIERVVHKCLAKDPGDRYQGMRDLVVDLRAVRRQLESGSMLSSALPRADGSGRHSVAPAPASNAGSGGDAVATQPASDVTPKRRRTPLIVAALAAVAIVAAIVLAVFRGRDEGPHFADGSKPSVAVLYFENNSGNASLDWMRTGLTDMVVTDLSQQPDVQVLSTDRLHRILSQLQREDDKVISADVVDAVAREAGVQTVLLGSFIKAGETIRINVKLQEAGTGRIVTSERVEGAGESNIFAMVDDLTRRIRTRLLPRGAESSLKGLLNNPASGGTASGADLDRGLKDVTTASVEAYRHYSEAIDLHQRLKEEEAVPLFKKALEIDPTFAMALAKLAIVHNNLNMPRESAEYARRALEHSERLTPRERLYIEAVHYSRRPETTERAIATYRKLIELFPDHSAARNNLALLAAVQENDDEVIAQLEELRRLGGDFPSSAAMLAGAYARKGDFARGYAILEEYLQRFPANASAHASLGSLLVAAGRVDEAAQALSKAKALGEREIRMAPAAIHIAVLRGHWTEAEELSRSLTTLNDPFARLVGWYSRAQVALYSGRSAQGVELLTQGSRATKPPFTAMASNAIAAVLVDRGDFPKALEWAGRGRREAKGDPNEPMTIATLALVHAVMGNAAAAESLLTELRAVPTAGVDPGLRRLVDQLTAEIALARSDRRAAIDALGRAAASLRPRASAGPPSEHVPIWYALARAHLANGDPASATHWFQRIVDSRVERVYFPIAYVRSFYFLGTIAEKNGDRAKAREYYQRFVDHWKDGDLDRDRVAEAAAKLRG